MRILKIAGLVFIACFFTLCACSKRKPKLEAPEPPAHAATLFCYEGSVDVKGFSRYAEACFDDLDFCEKSRKSVIEFAWMAELREIYVKQISPLCFVKIP